MDAVISHFFLPAGSYLFLRGVAALGVFSAAVGAMDPPDGDSSERYRWFYRFIHLLAANLDRAGLLNGSTVEQAGQIVTK